MPSSPQMGLPEFTFSNDHIPNMWASMPIAEVLPKVSVTLLDILVEFIVMCPFVENW